MSLKKRMNKSLILGLITSSVFVSGHNVYALNEDAKKETAKVDNKIELKKQLTKLGYTTDIYARTR